jgi:flavin reductase (DIM6/NTAB) family NADH-FMN oxidoreductase RutF
MPSSSPRGRPFDSRLLRDALGRFATGVTIVTTRAADGGSIGLTANSFNSVSLDPPLVLWSLDRASESLEAFLSCSHFAINVLAEDQVDLSRRFASPVANRFAGVAFRSGAGDVPLIEGCSAWFECLNRTHHEGGDHVIFVGEVEACGFADRPPLLYFGSRYAALRAHPDA